MTVSQYGNQIQAAEPWKYMKSGDFSSDLAENQCLIYPLGGGFADFWLS